MGSEGKGATLTNVVFMGEPNHPIPACSVSSAFSIRISLTLPARRKPLRVSEMIEMIDILTAGMGEPLQNFEAVLKATQIICHPLGLHFGAPRVRTLC